MEMNEMCPFGHKVIDFVNLIHRKYTYCYTCKKKFSQGDYEN